MLELMNYIGETTSVLEVVNLCGEEFDKYGAHIRSYHFVEKFASQIGKDAVVMESGFPPDWMALYRRSAFRINDPIPDFVMKQGKAMTWQTALAAQQLTPAQQDFARQMADHGLIHGVSFAVFGPSGNEAYASFSFGREHTIEDRPVIRLLVAVAQAGHRRIAALTTQLTTTPKLSNRELEVLNWLVRGKSVRDIATIINRQPATVETFVKRLYAKLKVHDRAGAIIVALRHGVVKL
jgi:DNA-binding CsgD family transcriptional regulator